MYTNFHDCSFSHSRDMFAALKTKNGSCDPDRAPFTCIQNLTTVASAGGETQLVPPKFQMVHVTWSHPFSGTVCHALARTCYDQPTYRPLWHKHDNKQGKSSDFCEHSFRATLPPDVACRPLTEVALRFSSLCLMASLFACQLRRNWRVVSVTSQPSSVSTTSESLPIVINLTSIISVVSPRPSQPVNTAINVDKTKVMAGDGIACRILIQNEQLEQVDTFPYLGSLITEDGGCTTEFRTRLNKGQAIGKNVEKSQHTVFNEDTTNESAGVACSNVWLWKLEKHVLTPLRLKGWERFCRFRGQQRKKMSRFLTKLE